MSNKRFNNKIALITASSTGIGLGIAKKLAQEGATVIISSRNEKHINEAVEEIKKQGGKAVGIKCNAGSLQDIKNLVDQTVKQFGGIDILIPNAAVSTHFGSFLDTDEKQMDKMFDVNIKGAFHLIKESFPHMEKRKGSNIVLISSYAGYTPNPSIGFYSITKTMLVAMNKILGRELSKIPVRVNCVAPGLIKTKFSSSLWEGREKEAKEIMGVDRLGEVEDIANCVAFLASDDASYTIGETILACGKPSSRL